MLLYVEYLEKVIYQPLKIILHAKHMFRLMGKKIITIEPRHEISNNVVCATSKGSDQPAHTRSLIRAFASHLNIL